jgi:hypothetical protein
MIASGQSHPFGVVVDATKVYWASSGDGSVHEAPKGGGADVVLAGGLGGAVGLAQDANHLFVTTYNAGTVVRITK